MKRRAFLAAGSLAFAAGARPALPLAPEVRPRERLATRAEATGYTETSTLDDVEDLLAELDVRGAPVARGYLGASAGGRPIPYVVAARPRVGTPAEAHALARPIVLVAATLDGSRVEGKEALLASLRDLCLATERTMLETLVLVIVPILNVDGNERLGPGATNAPDQNGPPLVGARANATGAVLDADFVRADAPETRAFLHLLRAWRPDVVAICSASDGSFHRFGATYAPALHPAADARAAFVRDRLLPAVRDDLLRTFAIDTFPSGRFGRDVALPEPPPPSDVENYGWFSSDFRPRSAANALGLRGTLALSVDAYAHDPLERRIFTTRAFIESVFGFCTDHAADVRAAARTAAHGVRETVSVNATRPNAPDGVATIAWENLVIDSGTEREPGVPEGFRRTGTYASAPLPLYLRYAGTTPCPPPVSFLVLAACAADVAPLLDRHAIFYKRATVAQTVTVRDFAIERLETPLAGRWGAPTPYVAQPGDLVIPVPQPCGPLLAVLIEPESADGFFASNVFDRVLGVGTSAPVLRVVEAA